MAPPLGIINWLKRKHKRFRLRKRKHFHRHLQRRFHVTVTVTDTVQCHCLSIFATIMQHVKAKGKFEDENEIKALRTGGAP